MPHLFDVERPAHEHRLFKFLLWTPLGVAAIFGISIVWSEELCFGWGYDAFDLFRKKMAFPLWIAALTPASLLLYLGAFRASQSAKQIGLQVEQNTLTNYYKHKEELAEVLEKSEFPEDKLIDSRRLHNKAFPGFLKHKTKIDPDWTSIILACSESVMLEMDEVLHDLSENRWKFSRKSSSILDDLQIISVSIGLEKSEINVRCPYFYCRVGGPMYADIEILIVQINRIVSNLHVLNREDIPDSLGATCSAIEGYCQALSEEWDKSLKKFKTITKAIPLVLQNQEKYKGAHTDLINAIKSLDDAEISLLQLWSATSTDDFNQALAMCGLDLTITSN